MKRCPTCQKTFTDRNLSFCIDDGTPLVVIDSGSDEVTQVSPSNREGSSGSGEPPAIPAYRPPSYLPPGASTAPRKRKAWPWVLGIFGLLLLLLVGMGIAAAIFVPKMINEALNTNSSNTNSNTNQSTRGNSNWNNSNSNQAKDVSNDNSAPDTSEEAPTDPNVVLAQLTDLEHEWTVANINADKKKLNRILADDYAGKDGQGKPQGKADYLRTATRDTSIQKWDFEDLKVDLKGDRASLSGIIRLQIDNKPAAFTFTDKFVWRDGRWQAVGSEVEPLTE